jgi:hypothetical protein
MVSKVCAAWLVLLVLLPFSAPFPTCDLASLFTSPDSQGPHQPLQPTRPAASLADAATAHALPLTRTAERLKFGTSPLHFLIRGAVAPGSPIARAANAPGLVSLLFLAPLRI